MPAHWTDDAVNAIPEKKETNPKDAVGTGKAPFTTIPTEVIAELGLVMLEGARKYGRHNYRAAGVRASVYIDAAMRHLVRFWEGEDDDPDSGMPHLVHAMACCTVLRDSQFFDNWTDDRPPKLPDGWLVALNERAKHIVEKYPEPVEAYTEQGESDKRRLLQIHEAMLNIDPDKLFVFHEETVNHGFLLPPVELDTQPLADGTPPHGRAAELG